jgi:hypothetical protein
LSRWATTLIESRATARSSRTSARVGASPAQLHGATYDGEAELTHLELERAGGKPADGEVPLLVGARRGGGAEHLHLRAGDRCTVDAEHRSGEQRVALGERRGGGGVAKAAARWRR